MTPEEFLKFYDENKDRHGLVRLFCGGYYYLTLKEAYEKFKIIYEREKVNNVGNSL